MLVFTVIFFCVVVVAAAVVVARMVMAAAGDVGCGGTTNTTGFPTIPFVGVIYFESFPQ
jgi:hypothetical protein